MELKSEALFVRVCCKRKEKKKEKNSGKQKRKEKKKEKDNKSREVVTVGLDQHGVRVGRVLGRDRATTHLVRGLQDARSVGKAGGGHEEPSRATRREEREETQKRTQPQNIGQGARAIERAAARTSPEGSQGFKTRSPGPGIRQSDRQKSISETGGLSPQSIHQSPSRKSDCDGVCASGKSAQENPGRSSTQGERTRGRDGTSQESEEEEDLGKVTKVHRSKSGGSRRTEEPGASALSLCIQNPPALARLEARFSHFFLPGYGFSHLHHPSLFLNPSAAPPFPLRLRSFQVRCDRTRKALKDRDHRKPVVVIRTGTRGNTRFGLRKLGRPRSERRAG